MKIKQIARASVVLTLALGFAGCTAVVVTDTSTQPIPTAIPTETATAIPTDTALPTVSNPPLPFTVNFAPEQTVIFTAGVQWHLVVTCTNDPISGGDIAVHVEPGSTLGFGSFNEVGNTIDGTCDGSTIDSNYSNPNGFPPGTYNLDINTLGIWTVTVSAENNG
jgi:hypothetical protein